MFKRKPFLAVGIITAALLVTTHFLKASDDIKPFLGFWAVTLPNNVPGWIEIRQESGYLDGDILWGWGSVVPLANVYLDGDKLIATRKHDMIRKKDAHGNPVRTQYITSQMVFTINGDQLEGMIYTPNYDGMGVREEPVSGTKNPPLPEPPDLSKVQFGEKINLFNRKDLTGWRLINPESKNGFFVEDGVLVNDPVQEEGKPHVHYGNLRTDQEFEDFNLKLEVNVPPKGNSGVYLRGIYEIQVFDSYGLPLDSHNMGGLYSRIAPSENAEKPAGEWQTMDITLWKRHLTVILNGVTIIDNKPVKGITGGALTSDEFKPGPIYLQGDHDKVLYRNIVLTPIIN
jgi:hypothetical protein